MCVVFERLGGERRGEVRGGEVVRDRRAEFPLLPKTPKTPSDYEQGFLQKN